MIRLTLKPEGPAEAAASTGPKLKINFSALQANADSNTMPTGAASTTLPTPPTLPTLPTHPPALNGIEDQFVLRLPSSLASILSTELLEDSDETEIGRKSAADGENRISSKTANSGDFHSHPGDLEIRFISPRTAIVRHPRFIKTGYPAVLVDAPTVMETYKSSNLIVTGMSKAETAPASSSTEVDEDGTERKTLKKRKDDTNFENLANYENSKQDDMNPPSTKNLHVGQYYKVTDLNQILLVLDLDNLEGQRTFNRFPAAIQHRLLRALKSSGGAPDDVAAGVNVVSEDSTCTWAQWPDGLTPPMRSARQRRFAPRNFHASEVGELERIEREVERLLKADGQAIESTFALYDAQGDLLLGSELKTWDAMEEAEEIDHDEDGEYGNQVEFVKDQMEEYEEAEAYEEGEEFVEEYSEEDELEDFAAEIEDNLLEQTITITTTTTTTTTASLEEPINEHQPSVEFETENDRMARELEAKIHEKVRQAESVANPLIKARIEDVIKQLEDNLKHLRENK